ncbi:unnamed protein product [Staurois parvus]|uniref:Uncharacterized protein n=1 Tax=Staurois parvus TaxID=386267 RepID=A0ABN9BHW7_9NEOB|nr:unnamed protein product [Staurois parvus]
MSNFNFFESPAGSSPLRPDAVREQKTDAGSGRRTQQEDIPEQGIAGEAL